MFEDALAGCDHIEHECRQIDEELTSLDESHRDSEGVSGQQRAIGRVCRHARASAPVARNGAAGHAAGAGGAILLVGRGRAAIDERVIETRADRDLAAVASLGRAGIGTRG